MTSVNHSNTCTTSVGRLLIPDRPWQWSPNFPPKSQSWLLCKAASTTGQASVSEEHLESRNSWGTVAILLWLTTRFPEPVDYCVPQMTTRQNDFSLMLWLMMMSFASCPKGRIWSSNSLNCPIIAYRGPIWIYCIRLMMPDHCGVNCYFEGVSFAGRLRTPRTGLGQDILFVESVADSAALPWLPPE